MYNEGLVCAPSVSFNWYLKIINFSLFCKVISTNRDQRWIHGGKIQNRESWWSIFFSDDSFSIVTKFYFHWKDLKILCRHQRKSDYKATSSDRYIRYEQLYKGQEALSLNATCRVIASIEHGITTRCLFAPRNKLQVTSTANISLRARWKEINNRKNQTEERARNQKTELERSWNWLMLQLKLNLCGRMIASAFGCCFSCIKSLEPPISIYLRSSILNISSHNIQRLIYLFFASSSFVINFSIIVEYHKTRLVHHYLFNRLSWLRWITFN